MSQEVIVKSQECCWSQVGVFANGHLFQAVVFPSEDGQLYEGFATSGRCCTPRFTDKCINTVKERVLAALPDLVKFHESTRVQLAYDTARLLTEAFKADPGAMHALLCNRVPCNEALADDPFIPVDGVPQQVQQAGETQTRTLFQVGLLSLVNGIMSTQCQPPIEAIFSDTEDEKTKRHALLGFQVRTSSEFIPTKDQILEARAGWVQRHDNQEPTVIYISQAVFDHYAELIGELGRRATKMFGCQIVIRPGPVTFA
jgi:hypothetical protein